MLQLDNLTYRWPNSVNDNISPLCLTINSGEWIALVGDNGAGKSTLLRLIAGLLKPTHGSVLFENTALTNYSAPERANKIGILFQEAEKQIFHSTVMDEVAFGLRRQKLSKEEIQQRTLQALDVCNLVEVAHKHPLDLHSGQRRMVAVACLSAVAPKLLLLDEPSRDFDARWMDCFEHWLNIQKAQGTTVITISHDLDFVARHFDRALHLSAGQLIGDGDIDQILRHGELQPASELPAPTLISLSHALQLPLQREPHFWATQFINATKMNQNA